MNYEELFAYVKDALAVYDSHGGVAKTRIKYSSYDHTVRVYNWVKILAEDYKGTIDLEAL